MAHGRGRQNTPSRSAKQVTRRRNREKDPRYKQAMAERDEAEATLAALEAEERMGPAEGAAYTGMTARVWAAQAEPEPEPHPEHDGAVTVRVRTVLEIDHAHRMGRCAVEHCSVDEQIKAIKIQQRAVMMLRPLPPIGLPTTVPLEGRGNGNWTLGQARSLLRKGYHIAEVYRRTGWGLEALNDLPVDEDGSGLSTEEWIESLQKVNNKKGLSA